MSAAAIHEEALQWQVAFWSGEMTLDEQQAFARWLAACPEHAHAWQAVEGVNRLLKGGQGWPQSADATLIGQVLQGVQGQRRDRRRVLRSVLLLAGAGGLAAAGQQWVPWQILTADYRTARGERKTVLLADGGELLLNSASAVDVVFDAAMRKIVLREGEIFIITAPDRPISGGAQAMAVGTRPFVVETPYGLIEALGTRFEVRLMAGSAQVAVYEGAVAIRPQSASASRREVRLEQGWRTSFSTDGVRMETRVEHPAPPWSKGQLVAEGMPLRDFLAELGRYRSGVLRCDPAVASLIVSGVYPLDDIDRVLAMLTQALPVDVRYRSPWWVTVSPRRAAS